MISPDVLNHIDISDIKAQAVIFLEQIDAKITESQNHTAVLQACRANVAQTFGIDRRLNPTAVEALVDSANRGIFEGVESNAPPMSSPARFMIP